jgi:hypothetical protein
MRGEKISFSEGGGINIVFGPKYRPLEYPGLRISVAHNTRNSEYQ